MQSQTEVASPGESPGRLSRWFSIRRGSANHYDLGGKECRTAGGVEKENKLPAKVGGTMNCTATIQMPQLTEVSVDSKDCNTDKLTQANLFVD